MSKALALLALTVLSAAYAVEVPQPSWTNHNRIAGSQQMMTNFRPWAEAVGSTIGDKRDKDDLAVYEKVGVAEWDISVTPQLHSGEWIIVRFDKDLTQWNFRIFDSNDVQIGGGYTDSGKKPTDFVISRTSVYIGRSGEYGPIEELTASATRSHEFSPVSPADYLAKVSQLPTEDEKAEWNGKLDKTASGEGYLGSISWKDEHTLITEQAGIEINGGNLYVHGFIKADLWSDFSVSTDIGGNLPAYLDSLAWRTTGNRTLSDYGITDATPLSMISETDPTFSNAVLAVGLNIDTNSVAVLNEIAATFGGFPITGTATTVGGLLAALAAAIAWLKKNKVQTLKLNDGSVETSADGGVAKLNDFFTESNSLLTATIDAEVISKGTAPDAHLEAPTDEHLKLVLADNSVAYDSAKALPYKLTSVIGDRVIATMTLTAASTDITLPTIAANDTTVKDFILDVTNAYAVEGVATDAGINIPRTDFKLVTRDGESLTAVTTVKAGKSAFICFTQKSPVVVDGTTYPCWCVIQLPFGEPS